MDNVIHFDFGVGVEVIDVAISPTLPDIAVVFTYESKIKTVHLFLAQLEDGEYKPTGVLQQYVVPNRKTAESITNRIPEMSALELLIMHFNLENK